jgi:hypothetical protein
MGHPFFVFSIFTCGLILDDLNCIAQGMIMFICNWLMVSCHMAHFEYLNLNFYKMMNICGSFNVNKLLHKTNYNYFGICKSITFCNDWGI